MRIHLGHHFYGAGNLGDDFMLAGFLGAMRTLEPQASFSCCVPFALEPLRQRFPAIEWLPYDTASRERCIAACDIWLGLGGSPFQSAQSRWFVDHLVGEADACARGGKPMFFLGVGVQTAEELESLDIKRICRQAAGIWTRDAASANRIRRLSASPRVEAAADIAHVFFRELHPPAAKPGRVTLVANFDFGTWPGQSAALASVEKLGPSDRVWLAQESRELPGAERALFAALPASRQFRWNLVSPESAGDPLSHVISRWPSGEWLLTARYHAALAGAWAGSKVVVIATNEKLRAAARELRAPVILPDADEATVTRALDAATPALPPLQSAESAYNACAAILRSAVAHCR